MKTFNFSTWQSYPVLDYIVNVFVTRTLAEWDHSKFEVQTGMSRITRATNNIFPADYRGKSHFYKYLQLRHFLKPKIEEELRMETAEIEDLLLNSVCFQDISHHCTSEGERRRSNHRRELYAIMCSQNVLPLGSMRSALIF